MKQDSTIVFSSSAIGNTHLAKKLPNQDSVGYWVAPDGIHFCVAISDGHGSSSHPYSDVGSSQAVEISIQVFKECFQRNHSDIDPSLLFKEIICRWSEKCISHYQSLGLGDTLSSESTIKLYGATLCISYVWKDSITVASIGDSTVFYRNHSGLYSKFLISDDTLGETTFSLCQSDPLTRLEVAHLPYSTGIILLSTDGVIKSLRSSSDYALIADYYLGLISTDTSPPAISCDLLAQLESFSRDGSGDDCTLAIVYIPASVISSSSESTIFDDNTLSLDFSSSCPEIKIKKKEPKLGSLLPLILAVLTAFLLISFSLYKPLRSRILLLIRDSLCGNIPRTMVTQPPLLLTRGR